MAVVALVLLVGCGAPRGWSRWWLAIGAPVALVSGRALGSLLFGVGASDPVTLIASVAMLGLAAVLATSIPLWRAAKLEPMVALRHE